MKDEEKKGQLIGNFWIIIVLVIVMVIWTFLLDSKPEPVVKYKNYTNQY